MALIFCEECGNQYSNKAESCPVCGCPTINNTLHLDRSNFGACSVEIRGNEMLAPSYVWSEFFTIGLLAILFLFLSLHFKEQLLGLVAVLLFLSLFFPSVFLPKYKKKLSKVKEINNYFKKRFKIVTSSPNSFACSEIINKSNFSKDTTMFDVYMEAYKFGADSIMINDISVTNDVSSRSVRNGSGDIQTKSTFHITAILIKY